MITLGDSLTVSVKAVGGGLTYQWYYRKTGQASFTAWNGRTHASEICTPNATWGGIQLYCKVTDYTGNTVLSNVVKITVNPAITITRQQYGELTVGAGKNVNFYVEAVGKELTYQWYYKKTGQTAWNKWNGKTTSSITVTSNSTWNGMLVHCVITDQNGYKLTSNDIKVKIS